jgi:hypothetical protein
VGVGRQASSPDVRGVCRGEGRYPAGRFVNQGTIHDVAAICIAASHRNVGYGIGRRYGIQIPIRPTDKGIARNKVNYRGGQYDP